MTTPPTRPVRLARDDDGGAWPQRVIGLAVALPAAVILLIAAFLDPSPTGLGTHTAMKLPPCGWIAAMDMPCPTCGMTTAFAHAANGNMPASVHAQPLGALLALATAMALIIGVHMTATGGNLGRVLLGLWSRQMIWIIGGLFLGSWLYKILSYKGMI